MKALTVWQPYASLIACKAKRYETRSWYTNYRGPVAIHAAKRQFDTAPYFDKELRVFADALDVPDIYSFETLPYGSIVAYATLAGCYEMFDDGIRIYIRKNGVKEYIQGNERAFGDWAPGRYAWEWENVQILSAPIPAKGMQGLWDWEASL